jgi:hypothetical protein
MREVAYDRDGLQIHQDTLQRVIEWVGELGIIALPLEDHLKRIEKPRIRR